MLPRRYLGNIGRVYRTVAGKKTGARLRTLPKKIHTLVDMLFLFFFRQYNNCPHIFLVAPFDLPLWWRCNQSPLPLQLRTERKRERGESWKFRPSSLSPSSPPLLFPAMTKSGLPAFFLALGREIWVSGKKGEGKRERERSKKKKEEVILSSTCEPVSV